MKAINSTAHTNARMSVYFLEDKHYRRAFPNLDTAAIKRQVHRSERQAVKDETRTLVSELAFDDRAEFLRQKEIRRFNESAITAPSSEKLIKVVRKRDAFTRPVIEFFKAVL